MHLANSLWPDRSEKRLQPFVENLKPKYGSAITSLDFFNQPGRAAGAINQWVAVDEESRDSIKAMYR